MTARLKLVPLVTLVSCLALSGCLIVAIDADEDSNYSPGTLVEQFDNLTSVQINTTSGDCIIHGREGASAEVRVEYRVRPAGAMTPKMQIASGGQLVINEQWKNGSGQVQWTLFIPTHIPVTFTSSSGSLTAEGLSGAVTFTSSSGSLIAAGLSGAVSAKSASGHIDFRRISGSISASTSSGDIRLRECTGSVQASSVSGTVRRG